MFYEDDMLTRFTVFLLALALTAPLALAQDGTNDAAEAEAAETNGAEAEAAQGEAGTAEAPPEAEMEQLISQASYAIR
ncbi:MAG: hypothetical protein ACOC1G_05115, partial [Phycisphaeraceae bacterium]